MKGRWNWGQINNHENVHKSVGKTSSVIFLYSYNPNDYFWDGVRDPET
jgi:hypothetical protein